MNVARLHEQFNSADVAFLLFRMFFARLHEQFNIVDVAFLILKELSYLGFKHKNRFIWCADHADKMHKSKCDICISSEVFIQRI